MISQFGEWLHGLNIGERPMMIPIVTLLRKMQILAKSHLSELNKGLVCGTMFGSSAALPILYPFDLKGLCLLDLGFFTCSGILFAVLNSTVIALYGHYTLLGSIVIVTLILIFQRNSLEAFGSYIPLMISLSLLTTVHAVPWIGTFFPQNRITLGQDYMAIRGYDRAASYQAGVDPDSVRSSEGFLGNLTRGWSPLPLELEHMHLNEHYQRTGRPSSPENSSSLDLETGLHEQAQSEAGSMEPFL